eukprot:GFYU01022068.1.p2 GENE.GFYU01022068.1~~GFYU01022068.1.p2  ORF type:complete len:129 (-),score=18.74 GFYU01022068.1:62-448(-)
MSAATKSLVGIVKSASMNRTATVAVERQAVAAIYRKAVKRTTTYKAHDKYNVCSVGDEVRIVETRPLSKTKRHVVAEVLRKANQPKLNTTALTLAEALKDQPENQKLILQAAAERSNIGSEGSDAVES